MREKFGRANAVPKYDSNTDTQNDDSILLESCAHYLSNDILVKMLSSDLQVELSLRSHVFRSPLEGRLLKVEVSEF